jgi:hypothetical protein
VTNLVRTWIQDDYAGATATLGEGQNFPDNPALSVSMMNAFGSALRNLCRKLRTASGPMLIFDNVDILGIPPFVSPTQGAAAPDPSIQVSITYVGYFNGLTYNNLFSLPANCLMVERVSERLNGSNDVFHPMTQPPQGLQSAWQGIYNGMWEYRQDAIWMPGSTETMDIRLRYQGTLPTLFTPGINTATTYIPINDSQDVLAAMTLKQLALRQGAAMLPGAIDWANEQIADFLNEWTKRNQGMPYQVQSFGDNMGWDGQR